MRITFPYRGFDALEVPDGNLMGVFSPSVLEVPLNEDKLIEESLDSPMGAGALEDILSPDDRVLVLVDDNTRLTPAHKILPRLVERLLRRLRSKGQLTLLVASGTHRPMSPEEKEAKYGREILAELRLVDHNWSDPEALTFLGETSSGIPIHVNKLVQEADFIIGMGHIVPHRVAGFSGGGKIVQPGICGPATTDKTHWISAKYPGEEIMGKADNPVRREIEVVARQVGLRFLINAVQDGKGRLAGLFTGDPTMVYARGTELARKVYGVKVPAKADIVVIDSYPADLELWQAAKGVYASGLAVGDGGVVVLVTPCYEGVATTHPEVERLGYRTYDEVNALVESGEITDLTVAAHLVHGGEVIKGKATGIMVSLGINRQTAEHLGFRYAATPQEALDMAFAIKGRSASVAVFHNGGEVLPMVG